MVLRNGGRIREAARELGMTHPNVTYHVKRANERSPITHGKAEREDQDAVNAYIKACLRRIGVLYD